MLQHGAFLTFKDVGQEASLDFDHVLNLLTLGLPVLDEVIVGPQFLHKGLLGTSSYQETMNFTLGPFKQGLSGGGVLY